MTWSEYLTNYSSALFDGSFMQQWGDKPWQPCKEDGTAAAKFHNQIISRITTQRLGYLDGVETAALDSVYALFEKNRTIVESHPGCQHFETIAWHVLNIHVRPFTAKWHRESQHGNLAALDSTDEFRAELIDLQSRLDSFRELLAHLRNSPTTAPPPPRCTPVRNEREEKIEREMQAIVSWGIRHAHAGIGLDTAEAMDKAERIAISERRRYYECSSSSMHAVGLALSGGGIRSATFSLGVLVALARRNLLPQVDYLSTVSGGGYIGSFLTAFLNTPAERPTSLPIGLCPTQVPFRRDEGEPESLRQIRQHSKYLASGSLWGRLSMMFSQVYGMLLNSLSIVFLAATAVIIERFLRALPLSGSMWSQSLAATGALFLTTALLSPLMLRFGVKAQNYVDSALAVLALTLLTLVTWKGLAWSHELFDGRFVGLSVPTENLKDITLVILGGIPIIAAGLCTFFRRIRLVFIILAGIAAPLFFFGVYLVLYRWSEPPIFKSLIIFTAILGIVYFIFLNINFTSPHRHYRNKLADAYLIQPAKSPTAQRPFDTAVSVKLSEIGRPTSRGPYHLINAALNVPASNNPAMQGRRTDFFVFSSAYCGSPLIGYRKTEDWEAADPHLDLGTAMAISGAAAAPQMGLATKRNLSFWLVMLNVRLGYWLRRPDQKAHWWSTPGLRYLLKEMLGTMDEKSAWLNVSDGGHIENLGVYELLRRRCKYIVAIDGEQDPHMTFAALTTLQRIAAIDFQIRIDVNLDDLRLNERGYSRSHFRFCRIEYPGNTYGYLLYVKLSLTGNEGEFLRRYRLDEPAFPHHSTADQFFTETQFEAYRSLGEHIGEKMFIRALVGSLSSSKDVKVEDWFAKLGKTLLEPLRNP